MGFRPTYQPSKRRLVYPNGAMQFCYSADEPERLRGPQHHYAWCDELAAWRYIDYAWDMLLMGLRLGEHPQVCSTTTPRPLKLIKELAKHERGRLVTGSTYANVHNLSPTFTRTVLDRYAGTTLGRQELDAEILEDLPGALVRRKDIRHVDQAPDTERVRARGPVRTAQRPADGSHGMAGFLRPRRRLPGVRRQLRQTVAAGRSHRRLRRPP